MAKRLFRLVLLTGLVLASSALADQARFTPLAADSLHDPTLPSIHVLQEPAEGMGSLPPSSSGNMVDWNEAVRGGYIRPRATLLEEGEVRLLDTDILMPRTGDALVVRFPHREHTEWLDCSNCHPKPFAEEAGKTPVSMLQILMGDYCGQCHGAVAFPLTECARCHSVSHDEYREYRQNR